MNTAMLLSETYIRVQINHGFNKKILYFYLQILHFDLYFFYIEKFGSIVFIIEFPFDKAP